MNEPTFHYPTPEGERIITTAPMSLERAREILKAMDVELLEERDGQFVSAQPFVRYPLDVALPGAALLEGGFTADQLEALAVWIRCRPAKP